MGQAKNRGTPEQRKAAALKAARNVFPESISCNNCKTDLRDVQPLDTRSMEGLKHAGAAYCEKCDYTTWVLDGDPESIAAFHQFLEEDDGRGAVTIGTVKKPKR